MGWEGAGRGGARVVARAAVARAEEWAVALEVERVEEVREEAEKGEVTVGPTEEAAKAAAVRAEEGAAVEERVAVRAAVEQGAATVVGLGAVARAVAKVAAKVAAD